MYTLPSMKGVSVGVQGRQWLSGFCTMCRGDSQEQLDCRMIPRRSISVDFLAISIWLDPGDGIVMRLGGVWLCQ